MWHADLLSSFLLLELMDNIREHNRLDFGKETAAVMEKIRSIFVAGRAGDAEITCEFKDQWKWAGGGGTVGKSADPHSWVDSAAVEKYKQEHDYLLCPHTAAGVYVMQ